MKTLVAYKENGKAHMLVAGAYYYDDTRLQAENNSLYRLGNGIIMGSVANQFSNLPLKMLEEHINSLEGKIELDMAFMLDYILPALIDMYKKCGLLEEDNGLNSLPESYIFIQNDKIFWIRNSLNIYEIDDFIVVGDFAVPLLNALELDYYKDLGFKDRIVKLITELDKFSREQRREFYHIDTTDIKIRRFDI